MRSARGFVSRATSASVVAGSALLCCPRASADVSKQQCIAADTSAQSLRRAGQFAAARKQLEVCGDPTCPDLVRSDCAKRTSELDRAQPTIVFDVKDGAGNDVSSVRLSIDGQQVTDKLTGTALSVDPGEHTFAFEAPGQEPVTRTLVLKEGEKDRSERVVVGPLPAQPPAAAPARASSSPTEVPAATSGSVQRTLGLVAGGVGIAGLAAGTVFGILAVNANSAQNSDCASSASLATCPNHNGAVSDHNTTVTDGLVSTVAFIGGGALLAAGTILFFTAPSHHGTDVGVAPSVGPGSAGLSVAGRF